MIIKIPEITIPEFTISIPGPVAIILTALIILWVVCWILGSLARLFGELCSGLSYTVRRVNAFFYLRERKARSLSK